MDLLKKIDPLVSIAVVLVGCVTYVHTTFAPLKYVDERHEETIKYVDKTLADTKSLLQEIRETTKTIEARTWDMQKDISHLPTRKGP